MKSEENSFSSGTLDRYFPMEVKWASWNDKTLAFLLSGCVAICKGAFKSGILKSCIYITSMFFFKNLQSVFLADTHAY